MKSRSLWLALKPRPFIPIKHLLLILGVVVLSLISTQQTQGETTGSVGIRMLRKTITLFEQNDCDGMWRYLWRYRDYPGFPAFYELAVSVNAGLSPLFKSSKRETAEAVFLLTVVAISRDENIMLREYEQIYGKEYDYEEVIRTYNDMVLQRSKFIEFSKTRSDCSKREVSADCARAFLEKNSGLKNRIFFKISNGLDRKILIRCNPPKSTIRIFAEGVFRYMEIDH